MKRLVVVTNNMGSRSAKALAAVLSERVGHQVYRVTAERVGNRIPFVLREGTDKLTQFRRFQEHAVACPEFSTSMDDARRWLGEGTPVVCRTLLRGSEGRGIVVSETADQLINAPLYTRYTKKRKEFRVHVFNGEVIDVQEKRKRRELHDDQFDHRIRNTANGYVFCRENVAEPSTLRNLAVQAVHALDYSVGAVDIGYNEHRDQCFVFEVNSTPGMEGTTLEKYATAIEGWYRGQA